MVKCVMVKYRGHVYLSQFVHSLCNYFGTYLFEILNKFYNDISFVKGLSSEEMFRFSDIVEIQGQSECVTEKNVSDRKEITENINDRSETEFSSVEDPLNMHRAASNETTLVSEIPNIINDKNVIIAPGQGKKLVSILSNEFCKEQALPYLLYKGKLGYNAPPDISISPARYFNQQLLNFNYYFKMHIISFLQDLCMSSTTFVHQ